MEKKLYVTKLAITGEIISYYTNKEKALEDLNKLRGYIKRRYVVLETYTLEESKRFKLPENQKVVKL